MRTSYLCLAGAMFLSGSAVVVSKMMVNTLPTFLATELGIVIGLLCLLPVCFLFRREPIVKDFRTNAVLLLQAVCGVFLYRVFTFWGLRFTSAVDSGLITSGAPVFVAILATIFLKECLSKRRLAGVLLVTAGLLAVNLIPLMSAAESSVHSSSVQGNLLILAAVLCESVFSVLSRVRCRPMTALYRTTAIIFFAFVLLLPFAISDAIHFKWAVFSLSSALCVLYYGVFVSFLSYLLWFRGIERVEASGAAVFSSVVPVSSIALSTLILGERISPVHVAGLGFILTGIVVSCGKGKVSQRKMPMDL